MLVYIAGPYRGKNAWDVERNIRLAEEYGYQAAQFGHVPIIPHSMYRFWNGTLPDEFWLGATETILRRCDAAAFIPGWRGSAGALNENSVAWDLSLAIWEHEPGRNIWGFNSWLDGLHIGQPHNSLLWRNPR